MSLTFRPMKNQVTISITTANSNTLTTLTSLLTITTTAVSSASSMVRSKKCMFVVSRASLLKRTDLELFFARIYKKL